MSWSHHERLRKAVEEWIGQRPDPRDPLTRPVELLLQMYIGYPRWRAFVLPVVLATLLSLGITAAAERLAHAHDPATVEIRDDEQEAYREWIASGEASRVMRCDSPGLVFQNGLCHTAPGAGFIIPVPAQQRLVLEGHEAAPSPARQGQQQNGTVASPW